MKKIELNVIVKFNPFSILNYKVLIKKDKKETK